MNHSAVAFEAVVVSRDDDNPPLPFEPGGSAGALVTYLELDPVTVWKGTLVSETVFMRLPGGVREGTWQVWAHVPPVRVGDRVVIFGAPHGNPDLINAVNLQSGLFLLKPDGTVRSGFGFLLAELPVHDPAVPHMPAAWENDTDDGDCAPDGTDCLFGDDGLDTDLPTTSPLSWSGLRTALTACTLAVPQPVVPAATIDHTGVVP